MNYLELEWPKFGIRVRAKLLEDKAPHLCKLILDKLPFESIHWHAVISGELLGFMCPVVCTKMENPVDRARGDVYLYANAQWIIIPYGATTEPNKVNKFGEIEKDDLEKLKIVGEKIWQTFVEGSKDAIKTVVTKGRSN